MLLLKKGSFDLIYLDLTRDISAHGQTLSSGTKEKRTPCVLQDKDGLLFCQIVGPDDVFKASDDPCDPAEMSGCHLGKILHICLPAVILHSVNTGKISFRIIIAGRRLKTALIFVRFF
jgi:hypothetical protein